MTSNIFFADATAEAANDAVKVLFNSGVIKIYQGTQPTDANTSIGSPTLLATFTCNATAFGASSGSGTAPSRVATALANSISDVTAAATGTAQFFRAFKSDGTTVICDGSVGTSGADLNMTDTSLTSGETCSISSLTLATPE